MLRFLLFFLLFSPALMGQRLSRTDRKSLESIQQNLAFLASDALKGRRAGDSGEVAAAQYIAAFFSSAGLLPKGDNGTFTQLFTVYDGKMVDPTSFFLVNNKGLEVGKDFFPLANSRHSGTIRTELSPSLHESAQPWMIDIADWIEENKENPHFDLYALLSSKANSAKQQGATALLLFQSTGIEKISFDPKDRTDSTAIPVVYLTQSAWNRHFRDPSASYSIALNTAVLQRQRTARNVVGFLNNGAEKTIVIGAHYDHLGFGEDGSSMLRGGPADIHNGADDNASGTSAMLALAQRLSRSSAKGYNYLFIAFSAEELGLNGSKYFVEHPTVPLPTINYMINMDMVGRLNDSTRSITIGGFGTSPSWKRMLDAVKNKPFLIKLDSSGTGPSDHTSFYRKDIPVLFFFTGLHSDYHKPSDDADKINHRGILYVVRFIQDMIEADKATEKLVFTKTREQQTSTTARFSVSMGIMPDYTFSGSGVRVDGVSENRPAKLAGILAGDIIKQLGDFTTPSVESYMQALSKFKKGDKTVAVVIRADQEIRFQIVF
jgi:aminopeptidase YwaD